MAEYAFHHPEIQRLGVGMAALSVDPPSRSAALRKSFGLPYPLLCDPSREVVTAWGLLNDAELGGIARPSVFVIDTDRTIVFRSIDTMTHQVKAGETVAFVRAWRGGRATNVAPSRSRILFRPRELWRSVANMLTLGVKSPRPGSPDLTPGTPPANES